MLTVFAYAFAHRKTTRFLMELAAAGRRDVLVLGAPWQKLAHGDSNVYVARTLAPEPALEPRQLAAHLGYRFEEVAHTDTARIAALVTECGSRQALISGARILKGEVIALFAEGVVNFHPGQIPQTSGLDAFFYTLTRDARPGTTCHFIDARVDAGQFLFFEETPVSGDETPEVLQANNAAGEIRALRRFLALESQAATPIDRPAKNRPMRPEEKLAALAQFPRWRAATARAQAQDRLFAACAAGDLAALTGLLAGWPDLVHARNDRGWTPLVVAAFNQHIELARALLDQGADPNAAGARGTTVLMYAKTALMAQATPDLALLRLLLERGADPARHDALGQPVSHYLTGPGAEAIRTLLAQHKA